MRQESSIDPGATRMTNALAGEFSDAVIALYEGITDPNGFSAALGTLSHLTGSPHSIFILWPNGSPGGKFDDS